MLGYDERMVANFIKNSDFFLKNVLILEASATEKIRSTSIIRIGLLNLILKLRWSKQALE